MSLFPHQFGWFQFFVQTLPPETWSQVRHWSRHNFTVKFRYKKCIPRIDMCVCEKYTQKRIKDFFQFSNSIYFGANKYHGKIENIKMWVNWNIQNGKKYFITDLMLMYSKVRFLFQKSKLTFIFNWFLKCFCQKYGILIVLIWYWANFYKMFM